MKETLQALAKDLPSNDTRVQALMRAQKLTLNTSGGELVCHHWGALGSHPNQTPLVLFHGGSGSWTHWIRNVLYLSQFKDVVAIDLPGMGESDLPPNARDADDLSPTLLEGLDQLFPKRAVDLMGFSFGALTGGFLAASAPERVERLVLVGTPGLVPREVAPRLRGLTIGMSHEEVLSVMHHNLRVMMLAHDESIDPFTLELQRANVGQDRLRKRRLASGDALLGLMPKWQCEVHSIWGSMDTLYLNSKKATFDVWSGCKHRSETVIDHAGHWVMYEATEAFHEALHTRVLA